MTASQPRTTAMERMLTLKLKSSRPAVTALNWTVVGYGAFSFAQEVDLLEQAKNDLHSFYVVFSSRGGGWGCVSFINLLCTFFLSNNLVAKISLKKIIWPSSEHLLNRRGNACLASLISLMKNFNCASYRGTASVSWIELTFFFFFFQAPFYASLFVQCGLWQDCYCLQGLTCERFRFAWAQHYSGSHILHLRKHWVQVPGGPLAMKYGHVEWHLVRHMLFTTVAC